MFRISWATAIIVGVILGAGATGTDYVVLKKTVVASLFLGAVVFVFSPFIVKRLQPRWLVVLPIAGTIAGFVIHRSVYG